MWYTIRITENNQALEVEEVKRKSEKVVEALKNLKVLREIYDYDLECIIRLANEELGKREEKRKGMINSLEDMCVWMLVRGEDEYTFHYSPKNPEELMKADEEEITDSGFDKICQQIGERGRKLFRYERWVFEVTASFGEEDSYFGMEIRYDVDEL